MIPRSYPPLGSRPIAETVSGRNLTTSSAQPAVSLRTEKNHPSGDDDFDVLADGDVVGRIFKVHAAPVGTPWMWTLAFGHHEDRWPTHGYEPTREAAMAAFAKTWRRQWPR